MTTSSTDNNTTPPTSDAPARTCRWCKHPLHPQASICVTCGHWQETWRHYAPNGLTLALSALSVVLGFMIFADSRMERESRVAIDTQLEQLEALFERCNRKQSTCELEEYTHLRTLDSLVAYGIQQQLHGDERERYMARLKNVDWEAQMKMASRKVQEAIDHARNNDRVTDEE